jgi:hypothetical protein
MVVETEDAEVDEDEGAMAVENKVDEAATEGSYEYRCPSDTGVANGKDPYVTYSGIGPVYPKDPVLYVGVAIILETSDRTGVESMAALISYSYL